LPPRNLNHDPSPCLWRLESEPDTVTDRVPAVTAIMMVVDSD
jgi:hypothetical protein